MPRPFKIVVACALAAFVLPFTDAWACRFNVRDVGFVELDAQPYRLCILVDGGTTAAQAERLEGLAFAALEHTNVRVDLLHASHDEEAAQAILDKIGAPDLPAVALVAPDGRALAVAAAGNADTIERGFRDAVAALVESPLREKIVEAAIENFGVVLVVDGPNEAQNQAVRDAAGLAVAQVAARMAMLPKSIARPPVVLNMPRDGHRAEKVLLWSLGLNHGHVDLPAVAVIYGRARQLHKPLQGDEITVEALSKMLGVIGADCECGLDRAWMQGAMLPVRWDRARQSKVADLLGFDPENPMTKMEISMTVGQSEGRNAPVTGLDGLPELGFGYSEITVDFGNAAPPAPDSPEPTVPAAEPAVPAGEITAAAGDTPRPVARETSRPAPNPKPAAPAPRNTDDTIISGLAPLLGGMTILVLVAAAVVLVGRRGVD